MPPRMRGRRGGRQDRRPRSMAVVAGEGVGGVDVEGEVVAEEEEEEEAGGAVVVVVVGGEDGMVVVEVDGAVVAEDGTVWGVDGRDCSLAILHGFEASHVIACLK